MLYDCLASESISDVDPVRGHSMDRRPSVFMKKEMKEKMMILSPIMAIGFSWCMNRFLLAVISLVSIFLCISVCSVCRKHESLWLFVLSGIATIPANIFLISGEMHLSLS